MLLVIYHFRIDQPLIFLKRGRVQTKHSFDHPVFGIEQPNSNFTLKFMATVSSIRCSGTLPFNRLNQLFPIYPYGIIFCKVQFLVYTGLQSLDCSGFKVGSVMKQIDKTGRSWLSKRPNRPSRIASAGYRLEYTCWRDRVHRLKDGGQA